VERNVHSLHCYFMLPGDPSIPIVYNVDRLRDGGSFTTRRVTAIQNGRAIFSLECSFQIEEEGLEHQLPMPLDVPPPEALRSQFQLLQEAGHAVPEAIRNFWARERPLEIKPINVEHYTSREKLPPYQSVWIRTSGAVPDERPLQRAILAYLSDMTLLDASTFPHGRTGFDPEIQMASLDHAMWFHRDHKLDDWLLYTQDTPNTIGARGFSRGFLYARDGTLIASTAQEGLVRLRRAPTK
jgi:acyl-CoA thioesterase-2